MLSGIHWLQEFWKGMKKMRLEFHNQTKVDVTEIKKLMRHVFKPIEQSKNMQVIFVDDQQIQLINETYRQISKPTDVISFPNDNDLESLGDVFISIDRAKEQADAYRHSFEREMGFLAVHGYLHLIGYDHQTKADEKEMFEKQETILAQANLKRK